MEVWNSKLKVSGVPCTVGHSINFNSFWSIKPNCWEFPLSRLIHDIPHSNVVDVDFLVIETKSHLSALLVGTLKMLMSMPPSLSGCDTKAYFDCRQKRCR